MADNAFDVAKAIEAVTSGHDFERQKAANELVHYLSENPSVVAPVLPKIACAVAIDP